MFTDFLTLDMLKVFFVAVAVTVLLTEFFKDIVDGIFKLFGLAVSKAIGKTYELHIPTKYVVFTFALMVVFAPLYFEAVLTPQVIVAGVLNGILLTLTAMKSYETILDKAIKKYSEEDFNNFKPPDIGGTT
jgi:hypothetical protein